MKEHFLFAFESWLWAVPVLAIFGAGLWMVSRIIARRRLARFISPAIAAKAAASLWNLRLVEFGISVVVLALLAVALARPLSGPRSGTAERSGVDLVILLDVSKSMLVEDLEPNRIEAVRKELREWLQTSAGDRVGLVPFAGDAFVMAPLTFDYQALDFVLAEVGPKSISSGGSNLPVAFETAAGLLSKDKESARVILLVSDGENLEGEAVSAARQVFAQEGVTIHTVGVGTAQGGKVPADDYAKYDHLPTDKRPAKGFIRSEYGTWVTSRIDERNLRAIAAAAGGRYYPFVPGTGTFRTVQNQSLLPLARKNQARRLEVADYTEWYRLPVAVAVLLMVAVSGSRLIRRKATPREIGVKVVQPENYSVSRLTPTP